MVRKRTTAYTEGRVSSAGGCGDGASASSNLLHAVGKNSAPTYLENRLDVEVKQARLHARGLLTQ